MFGKLLPSLKTKQRINKGGKTPALLLYMSSPHFTISKRGESVTPGNTHTHEHTNLFTYHTKMHKWFTRVTRRLLRAEVHFIAGQTTVLRVCCTKAAGACNLLSRRGGRASANFATLSVTDLSLRYLGAAEARSQLNLGTGGNAYAGTMSTVKYNKNKEGVELSSTRPVVLIRWQRVLTHTCEASSPNGFSFDLESNVLQFTRSCCRYSWKWWAATLHACARVQRQGTLWPSNYTGQLKRKLNPECLKMKYMFLCRVVPAAAVWKGVWWGATYRNAGAGAGAGGRRTLYRNQRHSVAGKRTPPESKQRWRDEHSCVEDEKTQSELGCLSPLVLLSLRCLRFSLPLRWLTVWLLPGCFLWSPRLRMRSCSYLT